jgi:putative ABC transport system substrate-binding protein
MRRREFMMLTAAGLAAVAQASAQPTGLPRVAFLSIAFGSDEPVFEAFSNEMRALGQIEGKTFRFELHVAKDDRSLPAVAEAMVRSGPTVLVALHSSAGIALHRLTPTIPIVVVNSGNPVELGLSTSIARPSGNVTGVLNLVTDLAGKRLEILRELVPAARRVGVLYNSSDRGDVMLANTMAAAQGTEVTIVPFDLAVAGDLTEMLLRIAAARLDGLIVWPSPHILSHRREIIESALASRLPTMHAFAFEAQDGGLAAYGTNTVENFQRAAQYVDRLLRGAEIADLPFDTPRNPTLTINLRTARAIGLAIPSAALVGANEVIE